MHLQPIQQPVQSDTGWSWMLICLYSSTGAKQPTKLFKRGKTSNNILPTSFSNESNDMEDYSLKWSLSQRDAKIFQ